MITFEEIRNKLERAVRLDAPAIFGPGEARSAVIALDAERTATTDKLVNAALETARTSRKLDESRRELSRLQAQLDDDDDTEVSFDFQISGTGLDIRTASELMTRIATLTQGAESA